MLKHLAEMRGHKAKGGGDPFVEGYLVLCCKLLHFTPLHSGLIP